MSLFQTEVLREEIDQGAGAGYEQQCGTPAAAAPPAPVAAVLGLSEAYVATLHNAAKRDAPAVLIGQLRPGRPGTVTAAQWQQARQWRAQDVSDAEIGRRLGVAHTTISRRLGPRGQGPARDGGPGQVPAGPLFTGPGPAADPAPEPGNNPGAGPEPGGGG